MDLSELFGANLSLIERVARSVCRRGGIFEVADVDDFVSAAKLALIEDDYAILRKYEARSSLSTFLTIVFHRLLADQRIRAYGRWNPSREAERMGPTGLLLETLIVRDRRSIEEALPLVQAVDPSLTRAAVAAMIERLPERTMRPRIVELNEVEAVATSPAQADELAVAAEARALAERVNAIMRQSLGGLPLEDRMLIRFRYGLDMSIADIARMMQLPQRPLYRRVETLLQRFRDELLAVGVDAAAVAGVIGTAANEMDFGLEGGGDEVAVAAGESSG